MQVLKFGGTSVTNAENINKVVAIVKESVKRDTTVVVVSALGGVTDLLLDAAALAAHIARETGEPSRAFAAYERQRQARSARVQSAARRNGRIYHLSGLAARARDRVLKSRGPERLIKSYDWLYGWRDWD